MAIKRMDYKYGYQVAKNYFEENGHLLPNRKYKTQNGESLGRWVLNQREKYNKGKLSPEQIKELEDIGMVWKLENHGGGESFENKFNRLFPLLQSYYDDHGDLLVPSDYTTNDANLGDFVMNLRSAKKEMGQYKGKLTDDHIKKLNKIGMVWDLKEAQWNEMYSRAKIIYDKYGSIIEKNIFITDGDKSLNKWFIRQRENYNNNTLSEERIDKLEKVGMIWDNLNEYNWQENYEEAKKYYEDNGHLLIPDKYEVNGKKLGFWIQRMRKAYNGDRKLKITNEQISLLNDIGMVWDVYEYQWEDTFVLLEELYNKLGSINVPVSFIFKDVNIGIWINNQRQEYRNKRLSQERIKKLEGLDIDWTPEPYNVSLREKIIYYYVHQTFNDAISSYKPIGFKGKELDIFVPSLNLAIEYDGEYWHQDVKKDVKKNKLCLDNGIKLIRVREPRCPKLEDTSIDFHLKDLSNESLEIAIVEILRKINEKYGLSYDVDIDLNKDYFEIVKLYINDKPSKEWEEMYELAKEYFEDNGDLLVPRGYMSEGKNLGDWVYIQRQAYKPNTKYIITSKQIKLLEDIEMIWDVNEYEFQKSYKIAKKYYEKHGKIPKHSKYIVDGLRLGNWVSHYIREYKKGKLSEERINLLKEIAVIE